MKQLVILATTLATLTVIVQQAPVNSPLLGHLAGNWLMQGTVGKQPVLSEGRYVANVVDGKVILYGR